MPQRVDIVDVGLGLDMQPYPLHLSSFKPRCYLSTLDDEIRGHLFADKGQDLTAANKCSRCHTATTTKTGPSFVSLAAKYRGDAAAAAILVEVLRTGATEEHRKVKASDTGLSAIVDAVLSS